MDQGNTSIALVQSTLTEFDKVAAGLADLSTKYKGVVYAVATTKGMDDAKAARLAIREPRYAVDRAAKAAKAPLNALKKNIDERAEQITGVLFALEEPIDQQIKLEEARREEEKRVKAEAEASRVAALRARVDAIAAIPLSHADATSNQIAQALADLNAVDIDAGFEEFTPHAADAKDTAVSRLIAMQQKALEREAEQEAMRRAQEELARQQAAAAAEAARLAAERAAIEVARQAAEAEAAALRKRLDDEAAASAAERFRLAAEADRAREAEAKKLADFHKAQQDAFEAERLAEEQKLQAARDQLAAERRAHLKAIEDEAALRAGALGSVAGAPATAAANAAEDEPMTGKEVLLAISQPMLAAADFLRPGAQEIVQFLASGYGVTESVAAEWITAAAEELSGVAA